MSSNPWIWAGMLLAAAAQATTLTLTPVKDNTLYENSSGSLSNGSGQYLFAGRTGSAGIRRALLAFDLSSVPANAQLTRAALTLTLSKTNSSSGAQTHALHRVLANWGEGSSNAGDPGGNGASAAPGDATWLHAAASSSFWSTPGGDYSDTPSASQSVAGTGSSTWESAQLLADVQAWITSPASNFGWILLGNESATGTAKRFDSSESTTAAQRPKLTLEYTLPNTAPTLTPIPDQTIDEDHATGVISLALGDAETTGSLSLSARSDNTRLLPSSGIVLGGTGASRTLKLTPAADQFGSATLTLTVSDGSDSTSQTFALKVNPVDDPPVVNNPLSSQTLALDQTDPFSIDLSAPAVFADLEGDTLSYTASSSDTAVVAVSLSGQVLFLAPRAAGSAVLTLSADDGKGGKTSTTFGVAVTAPALQLTGDFDGDQNVGFADFFLFADHFGEISSSLGWNPLFDLTADNKIGFEDFFVFADHFGEKATP